MYQIKSLLNNIDTSKVSLLFIAEGYTSAQEQEFYEDIFALYNRILDYECFNNLKLDNSTLSLHALYIPSAHTGISTVANSGNTVFDSYIDSLGLHISYAKFATIVQQSTLVYKQVETSLSTFLPVSAPPLIMRRNGTIFLPVLLFPGNAYQGELEFYEPGKFYFIGTTKDGHYEQVLARGIARLIGLGDEFDLGEPDFYECNQKVGDFINMNYFNLFYAEDVNNLTVNHESFKWMNLFPSSSLQTINFHPHPSGGSSADRDFPAIPLSYKTIELWEGGGLFRRKIFRSAIDCLQRRKIGDSLLPVKNEKVSLCPVCRFVIKKTILR